METTEGDTEGDTLYREMSSQQKRNLVRRKKPPPPPPPPPMKPKLKDVQISAKASDRTLELLKRLLENAEVKDVLLAVKDFQNKNWQLQDLNSSEKDGNSVDLKNSSN